jgi:hypothetical protein
VRILAGVLLCAGTASARAPELPRDLRGRLAIEVTRCRPIGRADALLEAEVVLRTNATAVELPGLHCGAYDDAGAPYFLAPVTGRLRLRAHQRERLSVRFAADATHRECGCTVRDVRGLPAEGESSAFGDVDAELAALVAELETEAEPDDTRAPEPAAGEPPAAEAGASPDVALGPGVLRYERVLAPSLSLRAEPRADAVRTGAAPPGARIAVERIERGWKLGRTSDGRVGWLPSDAASADVAAPERMAERLAPLQAGFAPGARAAEPRCDAVDRSALSELVAAWRVHEHAVYVRPLWYALAPEDRDAFQAWAADCYAAGRIVDAATGREIRSEAWEALR